MAILSSGGTKLYVERRGVGEPLLLIQGMTGHSLHWGEAFLSALEGDFELIIYDHRGAGRSALPDGSFTIADLAADAVAVLDALQIDSAHVVGISMGGMVAQELALAHCARVRTLTLGCTYAGGPGALFTDETVVNALATAILSGDAERKIRTGWEFNVSSDFAAAAGNYERFCAVAEQYPVALAITMAQVQAIMGHDTSARLSAISAPTLVVHGSDDRMLAATNGELVAGMIPGARLELLDGVGHLFFWEQPERAAQLIREHVRAAPA